jgi:hypothetical protein
VIQTEYLVNGTVVTQVEDRDWCLPLFLFDIIFIRC